MSQIGISHRMRQRLGWVCVGVGVLAVAIWVFSVFWRFDMCWSADQTMSRLRFFNVYPGVVSLKWNPGGSIMLGSEQFTIYSISDQPLSERLQFELPNIYVEGVQANIDLPIWCLLVVTTVCAWRLLCRERIPNPDIWIEKLRRWGGLGGLVMVLVLCGLGQRYIVSIGSDYKGFRLFSGTVEFEWTEPNVDEGEVEGPLEIRFQPASGEFYFTSGWFEAMHGRIHVTIPLWIWFLCFAIPALRAWLRWWRFKPSDQWICDHCGYDLRGNMSGICSECGSRVSTASPTKIQRAEDIIAPP